MMKPSNKSNLEELDSRLKAIHDKMSQLAAKTESIEKTLVELSLESSRPPTLLDQPAIPRRNSNTLDTSASLSAETFWEEAEAFSEKYGPFTQELARLYIPHFTCKHFGLTHFATGIQAFDDKQIYKFNLVAYSVNFSRSAMLISAEASVSEHHVLMLIEDLATFQRMLPSYCQQSLWGMIVGHNMSPQVHDLALSYGLYTGILQEEGFQLTVPKKFRPIDFVA